MCGMGVEYILKNSLLRRSLDNVTVVLVAFNNFKHTVFGHHGATKSEERAPDSHRENTQKPQSVEKNRVIERTKSAALPKPNMSQVKSYHQ